MILSVYAYLNLTYSRLQSEIEEAEKEYNAKQKEVRPASTQTI